MDGFMRVLNYHPLDGGVLNRYNFSTIIYSIRLIILNLISLFPGIRYLEKQKQFQQNSSRNC